MPEGCERLRCSPSTIYKLAGQGRLKLYKLAGTDKTLLSVEELDSLIVPAGAAA
jgi:excisionase family DNA binding protein